jgi:hypothetical protein
MWKLYGFVFVVLMGAINIKGGLSNSRVTEMAQSSFFPKLFKPYSEKIRQRF